MDPAPAAWLPLDGLALVVVAAAAGVTAVLSAVVGMAGGIALLAIMLLFLDPLVAVPLHGAVQLVSNASRTWIQRRHVDLRILVRYSLPLLPAGFAGLALARALPPVAIRLLIGVFVLIATWRPHWLLLGVHPEREPASGSRGWRFLGVGAGAGFLAPTVGATGPLIAPFFLGLGLTRFALVGTKAACQAAGHLAKLAVFGVAGFDYGPWLALLALLAAMVAGGTWLGSRLLERIDERRFVLLYKAVLSAVALQLFARELWRAL